MTPAPSSTPFIGSHSLPATSTLMAPGTGPLFLAQAPATGGALLEARELVTRGHGASLALGSQGSCEGGRGWAGSRDSWNRGARKRVYPSLVPSRHSAGTSSGQRTFRDWGRRVPGARLQCPPSQPRLSQPAQQDPGRGPSAREKWGETDAKRGVESKAAQPPCSSTQLPRPYCSP